MTDAEIKMLCFGVAVPLAVYLAVKDKGRLTGTIPAQVAFALIAVAFSGWKAMQGEWEHAAMAGAMFTGLTLIVYAAIRINPRPIMYLPDVVFISAAAGLIGLTYLPLFYAAFVITAVAGSMARKTKRGGRSSAMGPMMPPVAVGFVVATPFVVFNFELLTR